MQISAAQKDVGSNHAVSGLKIKILRHFLQLGYAVLLSDVDIVTLQNPFAHLHRDSDVEAMSDGWNNDTAYGKLTEGIPHKTSMPQDTVHGMLQQLHCMCEVAGRSDSFDLLISKRCCQLLWNASRAADVYSTVSPEASHHVLQPQL